MEIAFVLYDGFTGLDLVGPYEVITSWPSAKARFVATEKRLIVADNGLTVMPTDTPDTLPRPDLVVVPGSSRPFGPLQDQALLKWIRQAAKSATWMASVCTGSSIYAAAGLLAGRRATTHWAFRDVLAAMGVNVVNDRVVIDGPFISGAGVSAGIDMALTLTARLHGEKLAKAVQLGMEYDPQPPFDAGSPEKAGPEIIQAILERLAEAANASDMVQSTLERLTAS
ncbi:MAG TPA: DJ-1/PfpI family protein [Candidatus Acidoferrales bacterium]|nr:DJ-1/PfpI family protein [Candidatus Acidoferrales bacterium]